jgi:Fe-S-cluster-containing dehydrogenase component
VCMIGCPTAAIHRDQESGQIVIEDETCIGCGTCASSCPYENIRMVEIRDGSGHAVRDGATNLPIMKATKCDLCVDELGGPACQRACPHDALVRIDLSSGPQDLVKWLSR